MKMPLAFVAATVIAFSALAPGAASAQAAPPGDWHKTCMHGAWEKLFFHAFCKNYGGKYVSAAALPAICRNQRLENVDGRLNCQDGMIPMKDRPQHH